MALAAIAVPLAAGGPVAHAAPTAAAKLNELAKTSPNREVVALAQFKPGVSETQAREIVRANNGKVTDRLPAIGGLAVKLSAKHARALKTANGVLNVTLNTKVKNTSIDSGNGALTTYAQTVGADQLHAAGLTGKGVGVAVIDSGIAGDHPDFKNADGSSRVTNVIANPGATRPGDEVGHGTHVASIVAGNSNNRPAGDPLKGSYTGIAPDADLVAVKTADDDGRSSVLDVINGLQFVVDHKDELGVQVVNLSVSSDTPDSYVNDPLDAAVEFAWHAGLVVVAAAGNRGDAADAVQYAPGNDPYAISVGAIDENGTQTPSDDTVASFSSRGVTQDGFAKPDVLAPGAHIVAAAAAGSAFAAACPQCITDGQYFKMGGTSMAAPVVAGAAALILQARPDLNPDQVKAILISAATTTAAGPELDVARALNAAPGAGANQGLTPNETVYAALTAAGLDPTRATWTKATWNSATWTRATWSSATWTSVQDGLAADWARASWVCDACVGGVNGADPTSSTWSQSTWSQSTWSQSTWSQSSWSSHPEW